MERSLKCKNISYRPLARKQVYLVCNPCNWESIIVWVCAAINTPLTCRECNLFICRGKSVFSMWVSDICLSESTAPPDGWRPISGLGDALHPFGSVSVRIENKGVHWCHFYLLQGTRNADCWCTASSSKALYICLGLLKLIFNVWGFFFFNLSSLNKASEKIRVSHNTSQGFTWRDENPRYIV